MMKKIILSLACATILASSSAMNTTTQILQKVNTQPNTITNQQAQTKSALWQLVKANPTLCAVLAIYLAIIAGNNVSFAYDALARGEVSTEATNWHQKLRERAKNFFTPSKFKQKQQKVLNALDQNNQSTELSWRYSLFIPGLPTISLFIQQPLTQKKILAIILPLIFAFIIVTLISIIPALADLGIALYNNNPELKNKNLLIAVKNVIKNLLNKIFTQSSNVTATTDLIKKLNTITK